MLPDILKGSNFQALASFPLLKMSRAMYLEALRGHLSAAEQVCASPLPSIEILRLSLILFYHPPLPHSNPLLRTGKKVRVVEFTSTLSNL